MKFRFRQVKRRKEPSSFPDAQSLCQLLSDWFDTPLGKTVFETEQDLVQSVLSRTFGYHILQVGCSEDYSLLDASPISHKFMFSPSYRVGMKHAVADNEALPLETDSIDVALIHHALDFAQDSHRLLREVSRVVRPGGKLLIVGFNPYSSWGLWRFFKRKVGIPWRGRFISHLRVSDWLKLLDLRIDGVEFGLHFMPVRFHRFLKFSTKLEQWGNKLNSPMGGAYFLICTNQVIPITPIMQRWKPMRARVSSIPAAAENIRVRVH